MPVLESASKKPSVDDLSEIENNFYNLLTLVIDIHYRNLKTEANQASAVSLAVTKEIEGNPPDYQSPVDISLEGDQQETSGEFTKK